MKTLGFVLSALLAVSMIAVSCGERSEQAAKEDIEDARKAVETEKEQLRQEIAILQDKIDRRIEELTAQMENASDDVKSEIQVQINSLEDERKKLDRELDEIADASEDAWEAFKSDVRQLFDNIERELEKTFGDSKNG